MGGPQQRHGEVTRCQCFPRLPSPGNMARGNGDIVTYAGKARGRRHGRVEGWEMGRCLRTPSAVLCYFAFLGWRLASYSLPVMSPPGRGNSGHVKACCWMSRSRQAAFAGHGNRGIAMAAVPHVKHHHGGAVSGCKVLQTSPGIHGDDLSLIPVSSSVNAAGFEVGDNAVCPRPASTNQPTYR